MSVQFPEHCTDPDPGPCPGSCLAGRRSAGTEGSGTSVISHVGRRSGRVYRTPVVAVAHDDTFLIALPYEERTDAIRARHPVGLVPALPGLRAVSGQVTPDPGTCVS